MTPVTLRRTLFVLTVAAFIALAAGVLFVPSSEAVSGNCTYYNNANHTQIVGQFGVDCCNNRVAWGRKTQFSVCGGCFPMPRFGLGAGSSRLGERTFSIAIAALFS